MTEIALGYRAAGGLYVLPKVIIGEFKDLGKQFQKPPINRLGKVLCYLEVSGLTRIRYMMKRYVGESSDLVHKRLDTFGDLFNILVFGSVEIELRDTVLSSRCTLKFRVSHSLTLITSKIPPSSRKELYNPRRHHFRDPKEDSPCPLQICWRGDIER